jgi:hypothetical protein
MGLSCPWYMTNLAADPVSERRIANHKHDMIKDFNQLRVALRQLEKDHQPKKSKPNIVKVISETPESERQDIEELEGMVHQLTVCRCCG